MAHGTTYDLAILGGGTGGLVSAMIAAGTGARVVLIEADRTGGDCLWTGCVPSKSLLATAELVHAIRHADRLGVSATTPDIDLGRVMDRVRAVQDHIAPHDSPERLRAAGVTVLHGHGRFTSESTIDVAGTRVRFRRAIVATGSHAIIPPVPGLEDLDPLTNETVWDLRELPPRLAVIGAGPIGCELGQAFARLGSRVTIVDVADRVLPREEPGASDLLAGTLRADGIVMRLDASITAAGRDADGTARLDLSVGEPILADRVLVAAGRAPRTTGLGLDEAGVSTDARGAIVTDATMRTSNRRVFAIGDVTGGLAFTHVAAHHARHATLNALFGLRRRTDRAAIPWVTFTDPEVAHVGLTETEGRERWGDRVTVATAGYDRVDRAVTAAATTGAATLIGDPRGRLVGATLVGRGAGESIVELTAWITAGERIDRVSQTVHAYPTFAEAAARAADEHIRARFATPRTRRTLRPILALRRLSPGFR